MAIYDAELIYFRHNSILITQLAYLPFFNAEICVNQKVICGFVVSFPLETHFDMGSTHTEFQSSDNKHEVRAW